MEALRRAATRRGAAGSVLRLELALLPLLSIAGLAAACSGGHVGRPAAVAALGLLLAVSARAAAQAPAAVAAGACSLLLVGSLVALVALGVAPRVLGYRPVVVLSGSMTPTFRAGDVILVRQVPAERLHVGDVITYHIPIGDLHVESHRVVRIVSGGREPVVVTKGDANAYADPWQAKLHGGFVWRTVHVLPRIGYGVVLLRDSRLRPLLVVCLPALLVLLGLAQIWRGALPEGRLALPK